MNPIEKDLLARLESMPIEEARIAIHTRALGNTFDSPNHEFCLSWLAAKDASAKVAREEESLSISRKALLNSERATRIAISAIVLSTIMAVQKIIEWYSTKP